jgi:hypothetical protein
LIGDCGTGKTTLSIVLLMHTGLIRNETIKGLMFMCNDVIMYPGVVIGAVKDIGTDKSRDPQAFLDLWHSMSPQPPVFLVDGGKFVNASLLKEVAAAGCKVVVFDLEAPQDTLEKRHAERGRGFPRTWPEIAKKHQEVRDWAVERPTNVVYHKLQSASSASMGSNALFVLEKIGVEKTVYAKGKPKELKYKLGNITYLTVDNYLTKSQLDVVRWYIQNILYMREMGGASTNRGRWVNKPRGIRLEGDSNCGIAYKSTPVDPIPVHPITRFLLEMVNTRFNLSCNTAQFSMMFPHDADAQKYPPFLFFFNFYL